MSQALKSTNWHFVARVLLKATVLFVLLNLFFALLQPLEPLGQLSLYNWLLPGRERLPYGENTAISYNLSVFNVPAMFKSHTVINAKAPDEYRILVMGDSAAWGWFLENEQTLAAQINSAQHSTDDGKRLVAYNLGYPIMSLTKDLMLLAEAINHDPDLIVWPLTLESFPREKQLFAPLVQQNPQRIRPLIYTHDLNLEPTDPRFVETSFLESSIVGQRRNLADLLRLQLYGFSWGATGIDQAIPAAEAIQLRQSDFAADESWQDYPQPTTLTTDDLAFDVLAAGITLAGDVPVLIVNEPMFISDGENSDLRYNSFYPRWAYDQYRVLLGATAVDHDWHYLDLWDRITPEEFTDTPVHLTPNGSQQLAAIIKDAILDIAN